MTQNEVLELLKKKPDKWFNLKEIRNEMKNSKKSSSVGSNLLRLRRFKLVTAEYVLIGEGTRRHWRYKYNPKVFK